MDRPGNGMQTNVHAHEASHWYESCDASLYDIDYCLWIHQKDIARLRGAVHKMRSALPVNAVAYSHGKNDQTHHAHADHALDRQRSQTQRLDFAESSEPNDIVSELMEASSSNLNETTAHVKEHQRSAASDTNATDTDSGACKEVGCIVHLRRLQSAKRAGLANGSSEKQRIGLRRSPRWRKQT